MAVKKDSGGKAMGKKAAVPRVRRTAELAAKICAVIARGCTVSEAAAKCGCSDDFIYDWKREDADFSGKFTRAREDGSQLLEDMLIEVMRQEKNSVGNPDTTAQDVSLLQHVWEQGYKLLQVYNARFKERKAVELTGAGGKDLFPRMTDEERAAGRESCAESFRRISEHIEDEGAATGDIPQA